MSGADGSRGSRGLGVPTAADLRVADMLGMPALAIDDRQRVIRGVLAARENSTGVLEIQLRGCRARRRFHLRHVWRDWSPP